MNSIVAKNILRGIFLMALQVVVLDRIQFSSELLSYVHCIGYILFLMWLPLKLPRPLVITIGFIAGLCIDLFNESMGVHASAAVFITYLRFFILKIISPYEGYDVDISPTIRNMGFTWFLSYMSMMLLAYLLFFFSVDAFSFVYIKDILLSTIFSFIASALFIIIYGLIFNPKH